jgi:hypothetical protein
LHPWADMWGMKMRVSPSRLKGLGWELVEVDVFKAVSELVD